MDILTHERRYRGGDLLKKIADCKLIVCGVGAIGSNLVDNLSRQGFKNFTVIDHDRVESHNAATQLYGRREVGQLKVTALKNLIFNSMGGTVLEISRKMDASNVSGMLKAGSLVIDGFDNTESRGIVTEYCRSKKIECLHVGLYQDIAEVCWNQTYRVPQKVTGLDVCEYPLARNVILLAVAVASECLIQFLDRGARESYMITMKDFKILPR